jgi:hypothetical protein
MMKIISSLWTHSIYITEVLNRLASDRIHLGQATVQAVSCHLFTIHVYFMNWIYGIYPCKCVHSSYATRSVSCSWPTLSKLILVLYNIYSLVSYSHNPDFNQNSPFVEHPLINPPVTKRSSGSSMTNTRLYFHISRLTTQVFQGKTLTRPNRMIAVSGRIQKCRPD